MVRKIVALGKEIDLGMDKEITEEEAIRLITSAEPDVAAALSTVAYKTRVEDDLLVIYRLGAIFG